MDIPHFIECVKSHKCLWNHFHTSFTDKKMKESAWRDIMEKMGEDYMKCTKKWRTLRYAYRRYLKLSKQEATESNTSLEFSWPYFEQLDFLRDFVPLRDVKKTTGGDGSNLVMVDNLLKEGNTLDEGIKSQMPSQSYIPCSSNSSMNDPCSKELLIETERTALPSPKRKRESCSEGIYEEDDEDELFGRIVICKLRKFSEPQKSRIRINLLQTFLDIDVENCL